MYNICMDMYVGVEQIAVRCPAQLPGRLTAQEDRQARQGQPNITEIQ